MNLNYSSQNNRFVLIFLVFLLTFSKCADPFSMSDYQWFKKNGHSGNRRLSSDHHEGEHDHHEEEHDLHNDTAHLVNATNSSIWMKAPYFYNGTAIWDNHQTVQCVPLTNGSNGTNCSSIYGGELFSGWHDPGIPNCQAPLLESYGFSGMNVSHKEKVPFCQHIVNSCCDHDDQIWMYRSWSKDGVATNMYNRLEYFNNSYVEFINAVAQGAQVATKIGSRISATNNCKVLSNSIKQFQVSDVNFYLENIAKAYFGYHGSNFKSFYCTLCDADSHKYFDLTQQKIHYHYRHCKDIAANSLPFLLYFHVHFVKLVNLVVDFVASCDSEGAYTKVVIDEAQFKMQIDRTVRRDLFRCKNQRNSRSWYKACLPICKKYSMTKLNEFFLPNFKKLGPISSFIESNIQIIENHAELFASATEANLQKSSNARMLEVNDLMKKTKSIKFQRKLQQQRPPLEYTHLILRTLRNHDLETDIIPAAIGQTVNLDHLQPVYDNEGFQPLNVTLAMDWTDHGDHITKELAAESHLVDHHILTNTSVGNLSSDKAFILHVAGLASGVDRMFVGIWLLLGILLKWQIE